MLPLLRCLKRCHLRINKDVFFYLYCLIPLQGDWRLCVNYSVFLLPWRIFKHPGLHLWTGFFLYWTYRGVPQGSVPEPVPFSAHTCGCLQFLLLPLWLTFGSAVGLKQDRQTGHLTLNDTSNGPPSGSELLLFVLHHFGRQPPHLNSIATVQSLSFNFCFNRGCSHQNNLLDNIFIQFVFKKSSF